MTLAYPTTGTRESQQFGPASSSAAGYASQPPMFGSGSSVAYWQGYKGWRYYAHFHNGLDISGTTSTSLKAMESGKVLWSGWRNNGGGNVVEVEIRPGTRYTFNHCSRVLPKVGAIVTKGQVLAYIGATGFATGNHCHVSLDISERGSDGVTRWLMWNPKLWMDGGAYAGDARIAPAYIKVPRLSAGILGDGINIRSAPRLTSATLFAVTRAGRVIRYSDGRDLGVRTTRFLWYREVQGDQYTVGGVAGNRYVEVYIGGGHRFVAKPFTSAVAWYSA